MRGVVGHVAHLKRGVMASYHLTNPSRIGVVESKGVVGRLAQIEDIGTRGVNRVNHLCQGGTKDMAVVLVEKTAVYTFRHQAEDHKDKDYEQSTFHRLELEIDEWESLDTGKCHGAEG